MDTQLALLADYANITDTGKLNVMGLFSAIQALTFPTVHPQMYLVIQFRATAGEYNREFTLRIKLVNEDASKIDVITEGKARVPTPQNGQPVDLNFIMGLANIPFPTPGRYEFAVQIDNDTKATIPLDVIQMPVNH